MMLVSGVLAAVSRTSRTRTLDTYAECPEIRLNYRAFRDQECRGFEGG
jgi:hypothetical protein